mgnify:CR=1 FL=1
MIEILKDIGSAIASPEKYLDFMNYRKRKLLLYVLILVLFSGTVTFGIPAAKFLADGGFETLLQENIPNFTASAENGFWIEEPVEIDEYNFLVKANSDIVHEDITDLNGQYGSYEYVIVVDKEQIHLKTPGMQEITARFDEMNDFSFSKDDIFEYTSVMYMTSFWVFLLALLIDFGYYFITAFVVSWGAGVIASFMRLRLGNKKLFKIDEVPLDHPNGLCTTIPQIDKKSISSLTLSVCELNLVLEYITYKNRGNLYENYMELFWYIEQERFDLESRALFYSKLAFYFCEYQWKKLKRSEDNIEIIAIAKEMLQICTKGIEHLRNHKKIYFVWELLQMKQKIIEVIEELK